MDEDFKKNILKTGTTILGIGCKDGVVMAGCGSAAEAQKVPKYLSAELKLKELRSKSRPTVKQAAGLLSNFRTSGQSAYLLGGFNEDGSVDLYSTDPAGHIMKVEDYDANWGSGMSYVLGLLERQYKKGMSVKECVELAKEAIKSSTQRDTGSGNGIDIYSITKEGIKQVVNEVIEPGFKERE